MVETRLPSKDIKNFRVQVVLYYTTTNSSCRTETALEERKKLGLTRLWDHIPLTMYMPTKRPFRVFAVCRSCHSVREKESLTATSSFVCT